MKRLRFFIAMAYRESRRLRLRLFLCFLSIATSVAAFTSISLFRSALLGEIEVQSKSLLGADLILTSRESPTGELREYLASLPGLAAEGVQFLTMVSSGEELKLAQIRGIDPGIPLYGELEISPAGVNVHQQRGVVVDEQLLLQLKLQVGAELKIGAARFPILGTLLQVPGEVAGYALVAPRIYLARQYLAETALLGFGSQARYRFYYRLQEAEVKKLVQNRMDEFQARRLEVDTVATRRSSIEKTIERVSRFLSLSALITALLGGIGICSSALLLIYAKESDIRVIRLIGGKQWEVAAIFLLLFAIMGGGSSVAGAAIGGVLSQLFPAVFQSVLPVALVVPISLGGVLQGAGVGLLLSTIAAIIPVSALLSSTPLRVSERYSILSICVTAVAFLALAVFQYGETVGGITIGGGILISFLLLVGFSRILAWLLGKLPLRRVSFPIRYGVLSLSRGGSHSAVLTGAVGCGVALILIVSLTRLSLLKEITVASEGDRPNQVLFDIQREQIDPLRLLLEQEGAPIYETTPIVAMRLRSLKGRTVSELMQDRSSTIPLWTLKREYRSTYREKLGESERITSGRWIGSVNQGVEKVPLSIEQGIARDLGLSLGDELSVDLQGVEIRGLVTSIREVDWRKLQPNFFIVFPKGVIDDAPQFLAVTTRTADIPAGVRLQRRISEQFPSISIVDLRGAVQSLQAVLSKIAFAVNFMAAFTLITGLLILVGAALNGAAERMREAALLKLLGARKRTIQGALIMEFAVIGGVGALTGIVLAALGGELITRYLLRSEFVYPFAPAVIVFISAPLISAFIGGIFTSALYKKPTLEALRDET